MVERFQDLTKEIVQMLGHLLQTRPYIGIFDYNGNILYADKDLDKFIQLISEFIGQTFEYLEISDHSIPFSGHNLVMFKVSSKAVAVIYTKKGYIGQILTFKSFIPKITPILDEALSDLPEYIKTIQIEPIEEVGEVIEEEFEKTDFQVFPIFTQKVSEKDKFSLEDMKVIQFCDGRTSLKKILKKSKVEKDQMYEILENLIDKKKMTYRFEGIPLLCPYLTTEITKSDTKLGIVNKKEQKITELCDGNRSIEEIQVALAQNGIKIDKIKLEIIINGLIKKKFLKMRFPIE